MVALYALYVVVVITMNVLARRRRRHDSPDPVHDDGWKSLPGSGHPDVDVSPLNLSHRQGVSTSRPNSLHLPSPHLEEPYHDNDDEGSSTGSLTPTGPGSRTRRKSGSSPHSRSRPRSHSQAHLHNLHLHGLNTPDYVETPRANFSLLGAIEFRDVVNSLKREQGLIEASRTPSPNRSPYTAVERGDYFSHKSGHQHQHQHQTPVQGQGHRRSVSHAASRRTSTQYRSRAISHVVQPGSMATFTMAPSDVSPKRMSPNRTASAPGPVSPGTGTTSPHDEADITGDRSPHGHLDPGLTSSPSSDNPWKFQSGNPPTPTSQQQRPALPKLAIPEPLFPSSKRAHGTTPSISVMDPSGHVEEPIFSPPREDGPSALRLSSLNPIPDTSTNDSVGDSSDDTGASTIRESRFRVRRRIRRTLRVLFPSLQSFRHKSLVGKILSVFSVPAIFVLTLTLPVVDDGNREDGGGGISLPEGEGEPLIPDLEPGRMVPDSASGPGDWHHPDQDAEEEEGDPFLRPDVGEGLHHLVEGGFSPLHSPLGRIHHSARRFETQTQSASQSPRTYACESDRDEDEMTKELLEGLEQEEALEFNKSLCAAQCILGPTFCAYIVFGMSPPFLSSTRRNLPFDAGHTSQPCVGAVLIRLLGDLDSGMGKWIILGCAIAGLLAAIGSYRYGTDGTSRPWRLVRTMAGFTCSMVWIAAIADEVVSVLQVCLTAHPHPHPCCLGL